MNFLDMFLQLNERQISLIKFIVILIVLFVGARIVNKIISGKSKGFKLKKKEITSTNKGQILFLSNGDEKIDTNIVQLYGDLHGGPIYPGMSLQDHNGIKYIIKEVYADDNTPMDPNPYVQAGKNDIAIVLETTHWDFKGFRELLKKEELVPLVIK